MKYRVVYEHEERGWTATIPSVRGCVTWGRSLEAARRYIREALATCVDVLGEDAERIAREAELVEAFKLPRMAKTALAQHVRSKTRAEHWANVAIEVRRDAATALVKGSHISLRDAGALLGVSHESVHSMIFKVPARATKRTRISSSASSKRPASKQVRQP